MKMTKSKLRRIIKEELATINDETIEDTVMDVLSDEGGAAGLEPIESALEDLEDEDISLPDESIEDVIGSVAGVKRHTDGDYVDTTKLESKTMKITKNQLKEIVKEERAKLIEQMNLGSRGRGLMRDDMAKRAKAHLEGLYNGAINDFMAEEDLMEHEAEEMAVAAVIEVVKEFLDSVGYRNYLER